MTIAAPLAKACPYSNASADFDAFNLDNPFPFYQWARAEAPVFFAEDLGYYVVSRYADIKAVFADWQGFASDNAQAPLRPLGIAARQVMKEGGFTAYSGLSARIPPDHTRLRKIVQGCFGPRRFQSIEPRIRSIVIEAIEAFDRSGKTDFMAAFAYDVPALVLFTLVGVPAADVAMVKQWSVSRAALTWGNLSDEEQVPHAHNMVAYWKYCRALVAQRHAQASDDLPGDLVRLQGEGAEITDEEIAGICYSVLFAGHETTTTLLANGMRELLQYRQNWCALLEDSKRIPGAIEEILRFSPSIVAWRRRATRAARIDGVEIPENANILLLLGSANRDETVFPDGTSFDISRGNARNHLSFGYGIHACVGQQLAKLEFAVALEELTARLPSLRLAKAQETTFLTNTSFRVPSQVLVEWDAA